MEVYVIGFNGYGLMPTTPRKARILISQGRAEVYCKRPYTIRLLYKTGVNTQELDLGIDTGSQHIGVAVVSKKKVISKEEYALRSSMEKKALLELRTSFRKGRRCRKARYRHPKFKPCTKRVYQEKAFKKKGNPRHWKKCKNEFATNRKSGWLPPSLQSKCDHHIRVISLYRMILPPRTKVYIEVARFDVARIMDPTIHGDMYQKGRMYDEENIRAYVFSRDNYTCAVCKKKAGSKRKDGSVVKLIAHHIDFRSEGATDNPDRIISVCNRCHNDANHKPGGILYQWMIEEKTFARGYRDETFMNILRKRLFTIFHDKDVSFTYGNITSADRKSLGLEKTHANDAVAIACKGRAVKDIKETVYYQQIRHNKRSLYEATPRKGRKAPNTTAKRNRKNTKSVTIGRKTKRTFYVYDKVLYLGRVGWISGFTGSSAYVKDENNEYITKPGTTYKQVPLSSLKVLSHNNNWLIGARTQIGK